MPLGFVDTASYSRHCDGNCDNRSVCTSPRAQRARRYDASTGCPVRTCVVGPIAHRCVSLQELTLMNTLQGTIVAVTGAFGALGLVTASVLAQRGAQVALIGRGAAPATLPAELAQACVVDHVDLTDPQAAEVAVATIVGRFGALNALVNIAGGFRWETVADGSAHS